MTLRIESGRNEGRVVIRLIGRLQSEQLPDLEARLDALMPPPTLDLEELTLVDLAAVQFLVAWEERGVELRHCSAFIRRWMAGEGEQTK